MTDAELLRHLRTHMECCRQINDDLPTLLGNIATAKPILLQERDGITANNIIKEYNKNNSDFIIALCGKEHLTGIGKLLCNEKITYTICTDAKQLKSALESIKTHSPSFKMFAIPPRKVLLVS
ncbi:MAG: pheromone shutdown protein TraB [Candidatus Deianiraeaceae bacterium]|jgi:pheromone shutdown protein TraB